MVSTPGVDTELRIRDIVAKPGTKQQGYITVGETPMGPIQFPMVIISGTKPGPKLCITAGVHATEYPAIDSLLRTIVELDPSSLAGTVIAVPVVNSMMFRARSAFLSPIDGLNLNRTFPGHPEGSISEVLAHVLLTEVISQANCHIDCHGGDLTELLLPYTGYPMQGKPEIDEMGEAMARLYTPRIVALYRHGTTLTETKGSLVSEASRRGIPSILTESGGAGALEPAQVEVHRNGIRNIMRFLKMIPGEPVIFGERLAAKDQFVIKVRHGGLLRLAVGLGDQITSGQLVAEVCDVFGEIVERVLAPRSGIVRIIWIPKAVNTGESIIKCWVVEKAPAFPITDKFTVIEPSV
jgi:predicted deacylase